jgi:hypothetical protein
LRPRGLPPDTQPRQRVLDWLIKYAPSACSPRAIGRALRMEELEVVMTLLVLEDGRFVVRESSCFRAAEENDP